MHSGSSAKALNYPSYTPTRIRKPATGFVPEQYVEIPAPDEHRALPASTNQELVFEIPVLVEGMDRRTRESGAESLIAVVAARRCTRSTTRAG